MVRGVIDAGPVDCWQRPSRHIHGAAPGTASSRTSKAGTVAGSCAKSMGVATTASRFPGASSSKYSQTAWPDESLSRRRLHALAVVFKVAEPVRLSVDGLHPVMETFGDAVGTREAPHADNFLRPGMKRVAQRGGDCFGDDCFGDSSLRNLQTPPATEGPAPRRRGSLCPCCCYCFFCGVLGASQALCEGYSSRLGR